ncbi:hypothetical protein GCM10025876_27980 [Demequina litorisediminis]|uniref:Uncharacterized protein n=1 Tax=Demequina litorisediminis TaxID=1849022 RepID=A0ABQ6IFC1_9MICO|nr:hypothetical protein GCM10025876_27980 [Demequina litorisediminis]
MSTRAAASSSTAATTPALAALASAPRVAPASRAIRSRLICGTTRGSRSLYLKSEHHDGYLRDRDVFDDGIDIEDNLALVVDYRSGAVMTYSLNAHAPWEGYRVTVNGTEGRAELEVVERGAVIADEDGRVTLDPSATPEGLAADALRPHGEKAGGAASLGGARRGGHPGGHRRSRGRRRDPADGGVPSRPAGG